MESLLPPSDGQYRFAAFSINVRTLELCQGGKKVVLQDQSAKVLLILLASQGEIVSRQRIRTQLWGDLLHFDPDQAINKAINQIRWALGDTPRASRYIETVPRQGYRFVAPVHFEAPSVPESEQAEPEHAAIATAEVVAPLALQAARDEVSEGRTPVSGWHQPFLRRRSMRIAALFLATFLAILALWRWHLLGAAAASTPAGNALIIAPIDSPPELHDRADWLRYDLTDTLGHVQGVHVAAAHMFHGASLDSAVLKKISLETRAAYLLAADLRPSGAECILQAELIRSVDYAHVASFRVVSESCQMSELRQRAAMAIQAHLLHSSATPAVSPIKPEAYESYLEGMHALNARTDEALNLAIHHFQKAVAQQPNYAAAYAGMANVYLLLADHNGLEGGFEMANRLAHHALELDPSLALAHGVLGCVALSGSRDWVTAEKELQLASDLAPDEAVFHVWLASLLSIESKDSLALVQVQKAKDIDPYWPPVYQAGILVNRNAGNSDAMLENANKLVHLTPAWPVAYEAQSNALWMIHRYRLAIQSRKRAAELSGSQDLVHQEEVAAAMFERSGPKGYATSELNKNLPRTEDVRNASLQDAEWATYAGKPGVALSILRSLVQRHDAEELHILSDPIFAPLRQTPEYKKDVAAILAKTSSN